MDVLHPDKLTHNPSAIKGCFKIIGDVTVAAKDIRIVIPSRYINRGLAVLGSVIRTLSIYAIIDEDDNYAIALAPIMQNLSPYKTSDAVVNDVDYIVLHFKENDVVITSNTLVMSDGFMYQIFDEFYIKGNIPYFLSYDDTSDIFLETKKYANSNIGRNMLTFELITSYIARDPNDKRVLFRNTLKTPEDVLKKKPVFIGIDNIYYSYTNTVAKIVGGYFKQGISNALIEEERSSSNISDILRS